MRQVNETSGLSLDIECQRDSRRVAAVRFRVSDNPQILLFAQRQAALAAALTGEAATVELECSEARLARLREKPALFGLSGRQIRIALNGREPAYLEDEIAVVERDLIAGKAHNLPAYLLAALREDCRTGRNRNG